MSDYWKIIGAELVLTDDTNVNQCKLIKIDDGDMTCKLMIYLQRPVKVIVEPGPTIQKNGIDQVQQYVNVCKQKDQIKYTVGLKIPKSSARTSAYYINSATTAPPTLQMKTTIRRLNNQYQQLNHLEGELPMLVQGIQPFINAKMSYSTVNYPLPSLNTMNCGIIPANQTQRPLVLVSDEYNIAAYVGSIGMFVDGSNDTLIELVATSQNKLRVLATSNRLTITRPPNTPPFYVINSGVYVIEANNIKLYQGEELFLRLINLSHSNLYVSLLGTSSLTILDVGI